MIELLQKGLSAIQAIYVSIGLVGILTLIVNIIIIVKKSKDNKEEVSAISNSVEKLIKDKLKEHDIELSGLVNDMKVDNGKLAKMLALMSSKLNISSEDMMTILDNYKALTSIDENGEALADSIVEDIKLEEEVKEKAKITIEEEIEKAKQNNELLG